MTWGAAPALALALAACSGIGGGSAPPPPAASGSASGTTGGGGVTDRMSGWIFGQRAQPGEGRREPEVLDCPPLDVRQGASTIIVYGSGEQNATNVRWQASVGQTARECNQLGPTMTMKIGLQGRVIVGPVGGPGRLDVPIRFAVVHEGPEPKTIWTKLYRVPVDIPAGATNVPFVHVDDSVSFPKPSADAIDSYVVYVGFDQNAREQPRPQRGRRPRSAEAGR